VSVPWMIRSETTVPCCAPSRSLPIAPSPPLRFSSRPSQVHGPSPTFTTMKLVRLVLPSIAWTVAVASAHPAAPNASALPIADSSLADHTQATGCFMPPSAVNTWWYNTRTDGPHHCYGPPYQTWAMLNSYRSGGTIDVHWKYTDNVFDQDCLFGWGYYSGDGERLMATVLARITVEGSTRSWCALPVYRSGGARGKQWEYCSC
jgi:hypothetical protein